MNPFRNKFAAWTAVAALGAASLFAAETSAAGGHRHGRMGAFLSNYLTFDGGPANASEVDFPSGAPVGTADPAAIEANAAIVTGGGPVQ